MSDKLDAGKIAEFIKDSVETLTTTDYTCCEYRLDNNLSLFVGWSAGYGDDVDENDDTLIRSANDPDWAINVGIKSNHDYMKTDYDYLNFPYDEETGDVWDTGMTVPEGGLSDFDINWYIEQYLEIKKAYENGEIVIDGAEKVSKEVEEEEIVSFQEIIEMMDASVDYSDMYEAASNIVNTDLRLDVENAIGQCEDDGDEIDQAVSIVTSDLLDMHLNDKNVENLNESKKVEETEAVIPHPSEKEILNFIAKKGGSATLRELCDLLPENEDGEQELDGLLQEIEKMQTIEVLESEEDMLDTEICLILDYGVNDDVEGIDDIRRSLDPDFDKFEESKLTEEVQDQVYDIAEFILNEIGDKKDITMNEYNDLLEKGKTKYNFDNDDLDADVRTILSQNGFGTNFSTGDLTTDLDSLEEGKLEESADTIDNSEEEDLATYLYTDAMEYATFDSREKRCTDYELNTFEDVQDWYDSNLTEETYNKVANIVKNVIENTTYYSDSESARADIDIELSDNHTLWDIQVPDDYDENEGYYFQQETYPALVDEAAADFKQRTGEELKFLGRSGRHVCVRNHFLNAYKFNELKAIQKELEDKVIADAEAILNEGKEIITEAQGSFESAMTFAGKLAADLKSRGFSVRVNGEDEYVGLTVMQGEKQMRACTYIGDPEGTYGFEVDSIALGGDTDGITVLPLYVNGWDYETGDPKAGQPTEGQEVYSMFTEIEKVSTSEVADIIVKSFEIEGPLDENKKLEEGKEDFVDGLYVKPEGNSFVIAHKDYEDIEAFSEGTGRDKIWSIYTNSKPSALYTTEKFAQNDLNSLKRAIKAQGIEAVLKESKKVEENKYTFKMDFDKAESKLGESRKIFNDILENEELDEKTDTFIRDIVKKLCDVEIDIMNFKGMKVTESKKLEEKDTKQEYQDYCKDLGLDCNKKSSINKFLNDYAKNLATIQGTKDFEEKMASVKKELRESISKKEEATDTIELNTTSNILKGIADRINKTCSNMVTAQTAQVDDVVGIRLTRKGDQDLISLFDNIVGVMDANNIGKENYEIDLRGNDLILAVKNMTV